MQGNRGDVENILNQLYRLLKHYNQFNSIRAFISDKSPYYTGYINYNHRLLILN